MTDLLLDTHTFLWFVADDPRLSQTAAELIEDSDTTKHLSLASVWEIAIKSQLGKLRLGTTYDAFVQEAIVQRDVQLTEIRIGHLSQYAALPLHHRDPFDRLVIAQAMTEQFAIVTRDPNYKAYDVEVFW